jgi:5-(carboxyamino)imidazole ribonucleotide mutase
LAPVIRAIRSRNNVPRSLITNQPAVINRVPQSPRPNETSAEVGASVAERAPRVAVIMGSRNDWSTLRLAAEVLNELGVPLETRVVSAHRTPDAFFEYIGDIEHRGIQVVIAGAGGAAHLAGMAAAKTLVPVLGVPIQSAALQGLDSLLSMVQMPKGVPVGTLAIGEAGAANAALLAAQILALTDPSLRAKLQEYRERQAARVLKDQI